jgi:uncharacterized repeat protein (TIGR01451 family)
MKAALYLSAVLALAAAPAARAEMLASQIVEKEIVAKDEQGRERVKRIPADKVTPGETVVYSIRYENASAAPASDIVLVMPVPKEVAYVEGSVTGEEAQVAFSADGGRTYVARGRLTVVEDGAARPARGDEITHIKWTLAEPVPAKTKGEVSYKATLR